ncbi:uncharacterized protein LOC132201236 [Neocloeon triangulifer]|uniref:uncharacterized protein LOC132201236 n=1 Tax=Neocloeon triangulifer TaxID=2078957 RepID=UPI00286EBFC1|nr:uncharacterized protein LOC132201236 [Neocloeon triangulifer]
MKTSEWGPMSSGSVKSLGWLLLVLLAAQVPKPAGGHGRMMDPPARNSMWRFGFPNPVNYNDNELFCGGYAVQWMQNRGQCGICGDPYHFESPRPHEAGGQFAKGIIGRHYSVGQDIEVEIDLTANHWGRFELKLCPVNNARLEATQECFDRYPLYISGTRESVFTIPFDTAKKEVFRYRVRLPPYVTCSQCVMQWTYYTGNMWGTCPNGTEAVGCGLPETFRNCADVTITTSTSGLPPAFVEQDNPFLLYYRDYSRKNTRTHESYSLEPLIIRSQRCRATRRWSRNIGMDEWCKVNCLRYPPNCPPEVCECPTDCEAIGELEGRTGADVYCLDKCLVNDPDCPQDRCRCF